MADPTNSYQVGSSLLKGLNQLKDETHTINNEIQIMEKNILLKESQSASLNANRMKLVLEATTLQNDLCNRSSESQLSLYQQEISKTEIANLLAKVEKWTNRKERNLTVQKELKEKIQNFERKFSQWQEKEEEFLSRRRDSVAVQEKRKEISHVKFAIAKLPDGSFLCQKVKNLRKQLNDVEDKIKQNKMERELVENRDTLETERIGQEIEIYRERNRAYKNRLKAKLNEVRIRHAALLDELTIKEEELTALKDEVQAENNDSNAADTVINK